MNRRLAFAITILCLQSSLCFSQVRNRHIDVGLGLGGSEGSFSAAFIHNWQLGQKKRLSLGLGGRLTSYLGKNKYYQTAPAIITSGERGPQVFFIENMVENMDSLLLKTAWSNAMNITFNAGFQLNPKISVGFNIDLLGLSFGPRQDARYFQGNIGELSSGKPTAGNVLLVSDNDIGSLNSELFCRYHLNEDWGIKAGFQFLFTEYTTPTALQQIPEPNDRFRHKSLMFAAGFSYFIPQK